MQGKEKAPRAALYRNLGNWKFEDVTDKARVANERWGFGVAVGDYDNDGRPDMYVAISECRACITKWGRNLHRRCEKLGVARKGWSTGPTWGITTPTDARPIRPGYVQMISATSLPIPRMPIRVMAEKLLSVRGVPVRCGPRGLPERRRHTYRQNLMAALKM